MNGNQGLEALAALCGGEAAVATDKGNQKSQTDSAGQTQRDGASSAATNNGTQSTPGVPDGFSPQQWQQAVAAAAAFGAAPAAPSNNTAAAPAAPANNSFAQSLALLQAAGLHAPPAAVQQPPNHDAAQLMQQLAYFRHIQENAAAANAAKQQQQSNNAAANNVMNMNPLLYSNPQAMALALAGQAHQFQQHLTGGDAAARQQVLPPAPTTNAKSDASAAAKSMPPPPSGQGGTALPSTLSTAGIINSATSPRHTAIAPLPNSSAGSEGSVLSDGGTGYSSGNTSGGVVMEDKKYQKRAANRRSAQLSRKRKKQFIEELKDENDELRRKEQILRSIPDLIVVFDSTGKLWFVSQSVSRFMNMTAKELEGTSFWDRLCEDSVRLLKAAFMDSLAARNDDSDSAPLGCGIWELRLVDKDGTHKVVTLNGVVHFSGDRPECVCSIRPHDDPSMLPKRKQRKTADAAAATTAGKTGGRAAVSVSTGNGSGNGSDGTDTTATSTDASSNGNGVRFQPLVRAMPQQSVINNSSAPSARKMKAVAVNGKRREAARISDGDSGSTDDTDSGSSDELGEETTA